MNKKISELAAALSVMAADVVALVQNNTTKKITIEKLFGGIPVPVNVKNKLVFGGTPESINAGAISLELPISHLLLTGAAQTFTLALGVEGQTKFIVASAGTGNATIATNLHVTQVRFVKAGDAVQLLFTAGKWAVVGGTAQVS